MRKIKAYFYCFLNKIGFRKQMTAEEMKVSFLKTFDEVNKDKTFQFEFKQDAINKAQEEIVAERFEKSFNKK